MRTILLGFAIAAIATGAFADVTVAADGSGQFATVQAAVDAAPSGAPSRFVIRIKPGVYKGRVLIPVSKRSLGFIGEAAARTVITDDWFATLTGNDGKPIGTFRTASTMIQGDDFIAENITFANSAGNAGDFSHRRSRGISQLPFSRLAGHDSDQCRTAVLHPLLHRRRGRFHFRRVDGVVRSL